MENVYQNQTKESMSERHDATDLFGSVQPGSGNCSPYVKTSKGQATANIGTAEMENTYSPKDEAGANKKVVKMSSDEYEYADLSGQPKVMQSKIQKHLSQRGGLNTQDSQNRRNINI